jgi:SAM-dependent methyltransferase
VSDPGQLPSTSLTHDTLAQPSSWVARFAPLIVQGDVLDLACGSGRHSQLLAALGHRVHAVDRDGQALSWVVGNNIFTQQIDLESGKIDPALFAPERFAGIVVTNYLHRPLFAAILASLRVGGILIYETFAQGNERFGKPSNPDFLLKPGELLELARDYPAQQLRVIAFEDGYVDSPKPAMLQRICAIKTGSAADLTATTPHVLRI